MNTRHYYHEIAIIADELILKGFRIRDWSKQEFFNNDSRITVSLRDTYAKIYIYNIDTLNESNGYMYCNTHTVKYSGQKSINRLLNIVDASLHK